MKKINIKDLLKLIPNSIEYKVFGEIENQLFITNAKSTLDSNGESITFIDSARTKDEKTKWSIESKAIIIITDIENLIKGKINIFCKNPKYLFSYIVNNLYKKKQKEFIHPKSIISKKSIIGKDCYIGPGVLIEDNVVIGNNCVIEDNVSIKKSTIIGNNVKIQSGTVIGGEGFGYLKSDKFGMINFPHIGGVILEDNVEVGSNNTIDRGALSNTILRKDVKTDSLVHIAHNVIIGERTLIMANAMFSGSVTVGKDCWIAPSSSMRDGIKIGDNVTVGLGAVVLKDIPVNETWVGNPAKKHIKK